MGGTRKTAPRDVVEEMLTEWRRERPDLDSSGLAVVLRITLLAGTFGERLKDILAPAGLAPWEYDVLAALRRRGAGGGATATELCRAAQLSSGAMTHRLDRLESRGLVRRASSREDRRALRISLTSRGRQLVDGILGERMTAARESLSSLTAAEGRQLARLLGKLSAGLEGAVE